jgi:hypothetical protein
MEDLTSSHTDHYTTEDFVTFENPQYSQTRPFCKARFMQKSTKCKTLSLSELFV